MDINSDDFLGLIKDFFKDIPDSGIRTLPQADKICRMVDNVYSLVSIDDVNSMIKYHPLLHDNTIPDNAEILDCDDFALQLKAALTAFCRTKTVNGDIMKPPAIAIVITQNHALNLFLSNVNDEKQIFLIDPSLKTPVPVSEIDMATTLLKTLPLTLIYV